MNIYKIVFKEIWQRKSELITGILAITLGIGVIVGIRTVSVVTKKEVAVKLDNLGSNIMILPQAASVDNYYTADIDAPTFPEEYVEKIVTSTLPGVDNLSPKLTRRIKIDNKDVVLTGILPKSEIASKPIWQQSGGIMGNGVNASCAGNTKSEYVDEKLKRKGIDTLNEFDCFVGYLAAKKFNVKENSEITILKQKFKVIKILPETGVIDDDRIFANLHTVQKLLGTGEQLSAIEIMGCCNAITQGLLGKLRNILPDTRITTIGQIVSTQIDTNKMMDKVTLVFLIIILFVGGISIGNYIWGNVNERRKEIGILRMIGYSKNKIYSMLIMKAIVLGVLGGILGYVLGTVAAIVLGPYLASINVAPIGIFLLWSVLLSVGISIIGSIIPAYMAGKIEPFSNMQEV